MVAVFTGMTHAGATTVVAMRERDLARLADAIVVGSVTEIETVGTRDGAIHTLVAVAVEATLKGGAGTRMVLKQPGGFLADRGFWVAGSPEFRTGERQLLFLSAARDGTARTTALGLGQYRIARGRATRAIAAEVLGGRRTRRLALSRLLRTIHRALATGPARAASRRLVEPPEAGAAGVEHRAIPAFTAVDAPHGRWAEPDHGTAIRIDVDGAGDRTLGPAASLAAVDAALAAWTDVPGATPILVRAGAADAMPLLCDGRSQLLFGDPFDEMPRPLRCSGVLAVGGYCTARTTDEVGGVRFHRITEGNVTFNRGFGACSFWTAANVAEIATHELGHALGLDHASERDDEPDPVRKDATMYYRAHFDGRGAAVRADDRAALCALYPGPPAPDHDPDVDADGIADTRDNCPGDDPARGIANPAQTDLDGDGAGDLCDPCPLVPGDDPRACSAVDPSRLSSRSAARLRLDWRGAIAVGRPESARVTRVVLVGGDGVVLDTAVEPGAGPGPPRLGRPAGHARHAIVRLRRRRNATEVRLSVRDLALTPGRTPLLAATVAVGDRTYTTWLACRPGPRGRVTCRS